MPNCPHCSNKISSQIFIEGGYCPSCDELILADWTEEENTEEVDFDDVTEEMDITEPIPVIQIANISEEATEDYIQSEETFDFDELEPNMLALETLIEDDNNVQGYIHENEEESSEELLELPSRASLGLSGSWDSEQDDISKKNSARNRILLSLVAILLIGFIGAYSTGMLETEDTYEIPSSEASEIVHYVPEVKTVQPEKKVVKRRSSGKRKQETKSSGNSNSNYKAIEETTVGGITTFKSSGPVLSRPKLKSTANKSASAKLQEDISDLQVQMRYCHTKALKRDPSVRGKWEVSFTVVQTGKAEGVQVKNLREKHKSMEACMKTRVEGFTFSKLSSSSFQKFSISFG